MKYTEYTHLDEVVYSNLKKIRKGYKKSPYHDEPNNLNVVINLMDLVRKEYYQTELYKYMDSEPVFTKLDSGNFSVRTNVTRDELDGYFKLNQSIIRRHKIDLTDRHLAAIKISHLKEQKARQLVYSMIGFYSANWWY